MSQASKDSSAVLSTAASSALGGISSALRRGFYHTPPAATRSTNVDKIADIILSSINNFAAIYNIIMNGDSKKSIIDRLATLTPPIHIYCNKDTPDINNISTYYLITSLNFRGIDNDIFKYTRSKLDILAKKIKSEDPSAPDLDIVFLHAQSMYIQMLTR
jgi:hypothetical protein